MEHIPKKRRQNSPLVATPRHPAPVMEDESFNPSQDSDIGRGTHFNRHNSNTNPEPFPFLGGLDPNGYSAIPVELEGTEEFRDGVLNGTAAYFVSKLPKQLHKPVLDALGVTRFDFRDVEGVFSKLMDSPWRNKNLEPLRQ